MLRPYILLEIERQVCLNVDLRAKKQSRQDKAKLENDKRLKCIEM